MFSKHVLTRRAAVTGAVLAAVAGGGSVALASSSSSSNVYQGCLSHDGKLYRVKVNPQQPVRCYGHDTVISWNQSGPQGTMGTPGTPGAQGQMGSPGAQGATGPAGPAGPTGAAGPAGPAGTTALANIIPTSVSSPLDDQTIGIDEVSCPTGDVATGGGGGFVTAAPGLVLEQSVPVLTNGVPTGWRITVVNQSGASQSFTNNVNCVNPSAGPTAQAQTVRVQPHDHLTLTAIKP
jgi:hypothetical protein